MKKNNLLAKSPAPQTLPTLRSQETKSEVSHFGFFTIIHFLKYPVTEQLYRVVLAFKLYYENV